MVLNDFINVSCHEVRYFEIQMNTDFSFTAFRTISILKI